MAKDTKKRIIDAALVLFSINGYEATSMGEIAEKVGIKAPSLYDHYRNKQALFDAMVEAMRDYFWETYPTLHPHTTTIEEEARVIANDMTLMKELSIKTFQFYYKDKYAGVFRKLLSIERYRNPQMDQVYRELYLDAPIDNQTELFGQMMKQGYMSARLDPRMVAVEFFSPFLFIMSQYDGRPELEADAVHAITMHVEQFVKCHINM